MKRFASVAILAASAACLPSVVSAQSLTVGLAASTTSMDPQFYVVGPNSAMARNIFDGLVNQDDKQQIQPALAVSWSVIDDTTWEFRLREGVTFHDGSDFTAEDVVASLNRVPMASKNSPSSFMPYVKAITSVEAVDPLTVRITTAAPTPLLPNDLSRIAILPAEDAEVTTEEMNAGKGVIGTGPFEFVSWVPDSEVKVARNDAYWAGPAAWEEVTFKVFKNNSARVAAMLSGDVDMIESIPTADTRRLKSADDLKVVSVAGNRVMYLHMDQGREVSPFATGPDGKNPLRDARVRRALSLSLNREAIVDRIMDGQGVPAGQLVPEGYFGFDPSIKVDPYDPAKAKQLLAEAGYPDGFKLTFHASNDRYPNDSRVAQAIGQFFSRIGIDTSVETLPASVYFSRASNLEFSFIMGGAAVETGEASGVLGPLLETYGDSAGRGNRGRYSNPDFDAALQQARQTLDAPTRRDLLQKATRIAMTDLGVIPVFYLANTWALEDGLSYPGRSDGYTLAYEVTAE
ncbi:ABC transporter substrate-binding protein [Rhodovulum sulfidophilum]|uniref:ABC transporter substrate-binding protein n=1 Tax=Rhodovulum sulfidophilum TaxID=35806 RepID=UPI0009519075|nr:ABC transporter substrate-binding protein [Rhodovulum sulfidophilum]MBL3554079.1 ABC transporter substrate-binding protein [Rhodovulum sulfidophilum]OLS49944.1 ABC transporter substrate-binding protein [Rhodovulum sulfidophilum]